MSVFISYVHENREIVNRLCEDLKAHGIQIWWDQDDIKPGVRWKRAIRTAIREGAFFIACFSKEYDDRKKTYMNEELTIAIEELRQRPIDSEWFIPIKLNKCDIPDRDIGGGETLRDFNCANLYEDWDANIQQIFNVVQPTSPESMNTNTAEQSTDLMSETVNKQYYEAISRAWNLLGGSFTDELVLDLNENSPINDLEAVIPEVLRRVNLHLVRKSNNEVRLGNSPYSISEEGFVVQNQILILNPLEIKETLRYIYTHFSSAIEGSRNDQFPQDFPVFVDALVLLSALENRVTALEPR